MGYWVSMLRISIQTSVFKPADELSFDVALSSVFSQSFLLELKLKKKKKEKNEK